MIQDTGLGQEMVVSAYETAMDSGNPRLECCLYSDNVINFQQHSVPDNHLAERTLVYCVSPPGENNWAKHAYATDVWIYQPLLKDDLQHAEADNAQTKTNASKYPLRESHMSAIVKFYGNAAESVRVSQLVEVIGIRGDDFEPEENEFGLDQPLDGLSKTPVIHAIAVKHLSPDHPLPPLSSMTDTRSDLIGFLGSVLGEDTLAAEFLLAHMLSKTISNGSSLKIGQFALNLNGFPSVESKDGLNPVVKPLLSVLQELTVRTAYLPVNLPTLNKIRWAPKSTNENLESGLLQLVEGTQVLLDETLLKEGQLTGFGVQNVQTLQSVIQNQVLKYDFPYSQFDFDTDLNMLSVSSDKSILPNQCSVSLKPSIPLEDAEEAKFNLSNDELDTFRKYIHACKYVSYEIPESVAEYIQDSFVNDRKEAKEAKVELPTQEDLMFRLSLARLVTASFGELELTKERYDYVIDLDNRRKARSEQTVKK
ncbi:putative alanine racemase-domain-containing protein [Sporodiniella umbellata]|nr:putative alanine racemase-domain-containing protein [Sporodiniella umbellata]